MLPGRVKLALACLADDMEGITVHEAYEHMVYLPDRVSLDIIEMFVNCFPRGTTLREALETEMNNE